MKAFVVGLIFLIAAGILAVIGLLLYPLLMVCGLFLEILFGAVFAILAIWVLGKLIIYIWDQLSKKKVN